MNPLVRDLSRIENLPVEASGNVEARGSVEHVSTHGSDVFLTEHDVFKVKRPQNFGFLDYSTLEKREHFCREELRLNRRAAAEVYLGVLPVYRDAAGYSLTRTTGELVDWAVHMRRLDAARTALALHGRGELTPQRLSELATYLACFYGAADCGPQHTQDLVTSIEENFDQVAPFVGTFADRATFEATRVAQHAWLDRHRDLLATRASYDGHGDLRLEHCYFLDDGPRAIDCIEFTERFRVGDWALDVAFLAMDLADRGAADLGDYLLGRLAYELDDYDFWPLVDGYISYRAFVRGKVACFVASDDEAPRVVRTRKTEEARRYFALARDALTPRTTTPTLLAVGGRVASGKSTLARALAAEARMATVSADATRKALAGLAHETRGGDELYTAEFTACVHDELLRRASCALSAGRSVLVDTTFGSRALRERTRALAEDFGCRFAFVECRVDEEEALRRLRARGDGEVSDARAEHWEMLSRRFEDVTELPPSIHVVADGAADAVESARRLAQRLLA